MKVVSTAKLKTEIKERLITTFEHIKFCFFKNINDAIDDLVDSDILITYGEDLTGEIIEKMKNLQWIMVISAGVDRLPFEAIKEKKILVTNARGIHKIPMAEYTMAMILQVVKQTRRLLESEQKRNWDRRIQMTELHGKTLGILGAGAIGKEIATFAKVFQMKTVGLNSSGKPVESFDQMVTMKNIDELLSKSDFVVSVLPSTPRTDGLIDKGFFDRMLPHAVFMNIGRGKTVVEKDLLEALREQKIAHAVLDVFEREPLPSDHPFWKMDNVTVTPHISGISPQYQFRAIEIFEKNLQAYLKGSEDFCNVIDVTKGY
ncbi:D-2-hydroxyacid dehydrogenase [Anaerobacillus alkaliphilus]|uniref:D-2-hydroxyacid dehydrogenase n=1 Tax=Anaerobacillus alkaliphilus TaxID=1548597 RepID=A0A4Q0VTR2_9BACI|nr:D-2-hydroxyacid dehydrogenase [Anaerobacillus alkaliphilus]RXJ00423.1 D-2-hydroxyacid dehydrogenase [Anaerobacillus alkaliphilus]